MTPISLAPEKVETIVLACCSFHNYLISRQTSRCVYAPQGIVDSEDAVTHVVTPGDWRQQPQGFISLEQQCGNRHTNAAKAMRDYLCKYFHSENGSVPWQNNMV